MAQLNKNYTVLKSPVLSERATSLTRYNKYIFVVAKQSNKIEIRKVIEHFYKVKVKAVNIMNVVGKSKRIRWGQEGKTSSWKKAIVTLRKGQEIKVT